MIYEIHQHPEWEFVEEWFRARVGMLYPASDELALYKHVERIALDVTIDRVVEETARELGFIAGKKISELASSNG